ncbi:hypothetical protein CPC16_007254 [Podila verticillata]|nr:hypothetical protein BGZ59_005649 [Podila verticillata]KAF9387074.1 hypothetical protein CPC16_007254 [Podila verticillata]
MQKVDTFADKILAPLHLRYVDVDRSVKPMSAHPSLPMPNIVMLVSFSSQINVIRKVVFLDGTGRRTSETGKIGRLTGLAPIHQGTTLDSIPVFAKALGLLRVGNVFLNPVAPALLQMVVDSGVMKTLNSITNTSTGIYQANIATKRVLFSPSRSPY